MFSEERQAIILKDLNKEKSITVTELSKRLKVSVDTIRRDLKQLETKELIIKTHGGVMLKQHNLISTKLSNRRKLLSQEKTIIGKKASSLIQDGDMLFLDGSSSTILMIPYMKQKNLNIVTNSIYTAYEILEHNIDCHLQVIGGSIHPKIGSAILASSHDYLNNYKFQKAFISSCSIDLEEGFYDIDPEEAIFKRKVIHQTEKIYWLMDHSKFNMTGHVKISDIIGTIISDDLLDLKYKKRYLQIYKEKIK